MTMELMLAPSFGRPAPLGGVRGNDDGRPPLIRRKLYLRRDGRLHAVPLFRYKDVSANGPAMALKELSK